MKTLPIKIIPFLSLLFFACTSNNPVEPTICCDQNLIFEQLSHYKHNSNNSFVEFFPDSTFSQIDYKKKDKDGKTYKLYERKGKYKLVNNLLVLSDVIVDYDTSFGSISIIWTEQKVYLKNNKIFFVPVVVLETDNYKKALWNNWKTYKWTYHFLDKLNLTYSGREEYFYNFDSASGSVKLEIKTIDQGIEYQGTPWPYPSKYLLKFNYTYPELNIDNGDEKYFVKFKNDKMYWYENNQSFCKSNRELNAPLSSIFIKL